MFHYLEALMRRFPHAILAALLALTLLLGPTSSAIAWSNGTSGGDSFGTHDWVLYEAKRLADQDGAGWVDLSTALVATDDPDTVLHDTYHHVYDVWGSPYGDADAQIAKVYAQIVSARDAGNYTLASTLLGHLAHYYADISNPLHTDQSTAEESMHSSYETAAQAYTDAPGENAAWAVGDGLRTTSDVALDARNVASQAHTDYSALVTGYVDGGISDATVQAITRRALNRAANNLADVIQSLEEGSATTWTGWDRVAGSDRYSTAVKISENTYASADTVIVATGENWADALCAAPLAAVYDAPLLLVRKSSVPPVVASEIARLGATHVVLVGGEAAVSSAVAAQLGTDDRIAGTSRYATSSLIAARVRSVALERDLGDVTSVFVATGVNFPDALGASAIAADRIMPILLVKKDVIPGGSVVSGYSSYYVLGSTNAISSAVESQLASYGAVTRFSGSTRYDTAAKVIAYARDTWGADLSTVGCASGTNFPDALAAGAALGRSGRVQVLTNPSRLSAETSTLLDQNRSSIAWMTFYGGTSSLAPQVVNDVRDLLDPAYVPVAGPLATISASVSNAAPAQYSSVSVVVRAADAYGVPVPDASVSTVWHYKTTAPTQLGVTGDDGVATITRSIGGASIGYRVVVDVTVTAGGVTRKTQVSFTPR